MMRLPLLSVIFEVAERTVLPFFIWTVPPPVVVLVLLELELLELELELLLTS